MLPWRVCNMPFIAKSKLPKTIYDCCYWILYVTFMNSVIRGEVSFGQAERLLKKSPKVKICIHTRVKYTASFKKFPHLLNSNICGFWGDNFLFSPAHLLTNWVRRNEESVFWWIVEELGICFSKIMIAEMIKWVTMFCFKILEWDVIRWKSIR